MMRRQDNQGQAREQPVRGSARKQNQRQRVRAQGQLFKTTVFEIGLENALHGQQGREQRGDPDDAGPDFREQIGTRAQCQREQADHDDKEEQGLQQFAETPHGHAQVAPQLQNETVLLDAHILIS